MVQDGEVWAGVGATKGYDFHDLGTGWGYKGMSGPSRLGIFTDANERITVLSDGKVGIGTTNPGYRFEVKESSATWISRIYNTGTGNGLLVRVDSASSDAIFSTHNGTNHLLVVKGNGKVGIGTYTPDNAVLVANHAGTSTPTNNIELMGSVLTDNGGTAIFLKASSNTTLNRYGARIHTVRRPLDPSNGATDLVFSNENAGATSLDEHMRITAEGNVGIGDNLAAPQHRLHVRVTQ